MAGTSPAMMVLIGNTMKRSLRHTAMLLLVLAASPAAAQDIPGLENCAAEKQMERRTRCLQSNDDFLQRTLSKLTRDTQAKLAASGRDLAAAQAEIAALKSAMEKLNGELAQIKAKLESTAKK
jgi:septal ring factor EnvC (AmiA/AmiB activator)